MRILIDIGHPAHVHYFRNLINVLKGNGHKVYVIARNRGLVFYLLNFYKIPFISRGKGADSFLGKVFYTFYADAVILLFSIVHRIDTYMSFSTGYPVHIGFILRKFTISLNDTEHINSVHSKFVYQFSNAVITPYVYYEHINCTHIRFNNFMEGFYLHKNYFKPNGNIYDILKMPKHSKIVLLRFISWKAYHDHGLTGLSLDQKRVLITKLKKNYKVVISSESELEDEFKPFELKIPPERIHDLIFFSSFSISESATMASECAYLGTHVIYTNPLPLMGYLAEERRRELLFHMPAFDDVESKLEEFINDDSIENKGKDKAQNMTRNFVDTTKLLSWFLENLPQSIETLAKTPETQNHFR